MMDSIDSVAALVRLNGGSVVGKTRFQKLAYLLEAKGLGLGFDFDYHNYGPFSSDLATAVDDAEALSLLQSYERAGTHAVPYTVYLQTNTSPSFPASELTDKRREALEVMENSDALILELAATAVYLTRNGYKGRAWNEVSNRKPLKATPQRVQQAKELLKKLDLNV